MTGIMTYCKYRLPCGWCELRKKDCTSDDPFVITPMTCDAGATPLNVEPTQPNAEYKESLEAMKNLAKRTNLEMAIKDIIKE